MSNAGAPTFGDVKRSSTDDDDGTMHATKSKARPTLPQQPGDVKRSSADDDDGTMHATKLKARPTLFQQPVTSTIHNVDYLDTPPELFVKIDKGGLLKALEKLNKLLLEADKKDKSGSVHSTSDRSLSVQADEKGISGSVHSVRSLSVQAGQTHIISKKKPFSWIGREITVGQIGLVNHGGRPKILTKPGRYPRFPFANWWGRSFEGCKEIKDTVIEFNGLTVVQVSQNQAAVVSDPQNQIFVVKNDGFVALATEGSYSVLSVVDQTHLPNVLTDPTTKVTLGHWQEVKMRSRMGPSNTAYEFVVAMFLDIPVNNCAILQNGNELEILHAGQHCITKPNTTLRKMFTYVECHAEMQTKDILTRDQVPVSLTIDLKWQLTNPRKLIDHGYDTPYEALRDKTQSILTQIMPHLDYSSMVKQRSIIDLNDTVDDETDPSTAFFDALRSRAMDDLKDAAVKYGIILKDFAVIDRQFKGEIAMTMDKLITRALQAQVEAANLDRENTNRVKKEQGLLQVAQVQASARKTQADAEAHAIITKANAMAEATRIAARADADAIRLKATADQEVQDAYAREMGLRRNEVEKIAAYGNKTVFVPVGGAAGSGAADAVALGFAAGIGSDMRKSWNAEQQPEPQPQPQQLGGSPKPPAK